MSAVPLGEGNQGRESKGPQDLLNYLRGQFRDAHLKEASRDNRGERAPHGSFWQDRPLEEDHAMTRGSEKIVLSLPYPADDKSPYEVFALLDKSEGDEESDEPEKESLIAWEVDRFLVRSAPRDDQKGPFYLVDANGASRVELDDEAFSILEAGVVVMDVKKQQLGEAQDLLGKLSIRNIVALGISQ